MATFAVVPPAPRQRHKRIINLDAIETADYDEPARRLTVVWRGLGADGAARWQWYDDDAAEALWLAILANGPFADILEQPASIEVHV
ncbi:MAG: hypothetical protein ACSLE9_07785 [Burkholderiaceae bacterium]